MNILFIAHENIMNGANKSMINLIDELSSKHNFFVWCRGGSQGKLIEELNYRKVVHYDQKFYCWCTYQPNGIIGLLKRKIRWFVKERPINNLAADSIKDFIIDNRIDVIHTNSSVIDIGVMLKKKYNIPLVWHIREFGEEDFGWKPLCSYSKFYREIRDSADAVIAISKAVGKKYVGKLNEGQLHVIYNGVPISQSDIKKSKEQTGLVTFLETGVLCEAKGQSVAIEAMRILKDRGYSGIRLILAGRGDLSEITKGLKTDDIDIQHLGQVEDMETLRHNVDVELVCSRAEAFGRVTVEAMMSGLPVIGSNSGGTPELIVDNETGFIFQNGDAEDLADKMACLVDNRKLMLIMGEKALAYSRRNFGIEKCAAAVDKIYSDVIKC